MKSIWSKEVDAILSNGHFLEGIGIFNWALGRQAALKALQQLLAINVAVPGGDVYRKNGQHVEASYDNWYCNRNFEENEFDFVVRSIVLARNYISSYQVMSDDVLFVLVPSL